MAIMDFFKKLLGGGEPATPRPVDAAARSDTAMDATVAATAAAAPAAPMAAAAADEAADPASDEPDTQSADSDTPPTS